MHSSLSSFPAGSRRDLASTGVALLRWDCVDPSRDRWRLSRRERAVHERIDRPERRRSWLAGRLITKYLFLDELGRGREGRRGIRFPDGVKELDPGLLGAFSPWLYRKIEVLPPDDRTGSAPVLSWCGRTINRPVSISHAPSHSVAVLGGGSVAGIDLEVAKARVDSFDHGNFSSGERNWVRGNASDRLPAAWLYTFLWTVKESALKAELPGGLSIWDFPRLEVEISEESSRSLAGLAGPARLGERLTPVTLTINHSLQKTKLNAGISATADRVLTVIQN